MSLNLDQKKERSEYLGKNLKITECSGDEKYVFISYASDNWEAVFKNAVVPLQKEYGLRVYADKAFDKENDKWIIPMLRNIRGADAVMAFVSQSYIESYACFLELLTAVNANIPIVFVSVDSNLKLGNTTDQPVIETAAKREISRQGDNLATRTNNTSKDIMRAMKSAYTSLSTLIEQEVLSKYDITDAFINFFRDAAVNKKTIADINALYGTLRSVSQRVFEEIVPETHPELVVEKRVENAPETHIEPAVENRVEPAPESHAEPVVENQVQHAPYVENAAGRQVPDTKIAQTAPAENTRNALDKRKRNIMIIAAGVVAVIAAVLIIIIANSPKNIKDKSYVYNYEGKSIVATYTGKWKNDMPVGEGSCTFDNAKENGFLLQSFEGEWEDGEMKHGKAVETTCNDGTNHNFYEGDFKNGVYHGKGTVTIYFKSRTDRDVAECDWVDGVRTGQGTLTTYDENGKVTYTYSGGWLNNKYEGSGKQTFYENEKPTQEYTGEWKDSKKNGQGTLSFYDENGEVTSTKEGEWKDDLQNGQGKYTWADGGVYEGEFKDGDINGQGKKTYANGDVYEGEWKDGEYNGQGKYTKADGTVQEGEWKDNIFLG